MVSVALVTSILLSLFGCDATKSKQRYTKTYLNYFDTATTIIGYAESEEEFLRVSGIVSDMLGEYHRLYDIYNRYEGLVNIATLNALFEGEHRAFVVDERIMSLLLYCKQVYSITGGETNIAMGSVLKLWHDRREAAISNPDAAALPTYDKLLAASEHTDINDLILDEENMTVYIADPDMRLDVGAVAKGYATEMAARELERMGISGYILNVGGNIRTVGTRPDGSDWTVGVENPDKSSDEAYIEYVSLSGEAFVTSGSYHRYFELDGKRYHHIIDKDTLYPSEYFTSVSVLCSDSGLADALSTALFSMSYESGLTLIGSIENAEAMWYTKDGEKLYSSGFSEYIKIMD